MLTEEFKRMIRHYTLRPVRYGFAIWPQATISQNYEQQILENIRAFNQQDLNELSSLLDDIERNEPVHTIGSSPSQLFKTSLRHSGLNWIVDALMKAFCVTAIVDLLARALTIDPDINQMWMLRVCVFFVTISRHVTNYGDLETMRDERIKGIRKAISIKIDVETELDAALEANIIHNNPLNL